MKYETMTERLARMKAQRAERAPQAGSLGNLSAHTLGTYKPGNRLVFIGPEGQPLEGFLISKTNRETWRITHEGDLMYIPTKLVLRRGTPIAEAVAAVRELTPEQQQARIEDAARAYAFVVSRNVLEREAANPTTLQNVMSLQQVEQNIINATAEAMEREGGNLYGTHSTLNRKAPAEFDRGVTHATD